MPATRSREAVEALIRDHSRLAKDEVGIAYSKRSKFGRLDFDEMMSRAVLALWRAAETWDDARGVPFIHFARMVVKRAIIDYQRVFGHYTRAGYVRNAHRFLSELASEEGEEPVGIRSRCGRTPICPVEEQDTFDVLLGPLEDETDREIVALHYRENWTDKAVARQIGLGISQTANRRDMAIFSLKVAHRSRAS